MIDIFDDAANKPMPFIEFAFIHDILLLLVDASAIPSCKLLKNLEVHQMLGRQCPPKITVFAAMHLVLLPPKIAFFSAWLFVIISVNSCVCIGLIFLIVKFHSVTTRSGRGDYFRRKDHRRRLLWVSSVCCGQSSPAFLSA